MAAPKPQPQPVSQPSPEQVRTRLAAMLRSRYFLPARLETLLLKHLVERTLAGDRAALNETAIAMAVFRRDASYDPVADGVVGLVAGRLRRRLASYYASRREPDSILRIELPRGSLVPLFVRPGRRTRTLTLRILLVAALAAAAGGAFHAVRSAKPAPRSYKSVAVLPFRNLNQIPSLDRYGAEVVTRLQAGLGNTAGLRLGPSVPPGYEETFGSDMITLAHELSVDAVVRGDVFVRDPDIRISVELVDGATGKTVWSDVYEVTESQVPTMGNDILYALRGVLAPGR